MKPKLESMINHQLGKVLQDSDFLESVVSDIFNKPSTTIEESEEIINSINQRIQNNPEDAQNYISLGDVYLDHEINHEKAVEAFNTALHYSKDNKTRITIFNYLSQTHEKLNNATLALNYHTEYIKLKQSENDLITTDDYFNQAKLYKKTKQPAKSIKCFNIYIEKTINQINSSEPDPKKRDYSELLGAYSSILEMCKPNKKSIIKQDCIDDLKHLLPNNAHAKELIFMYTTPKTKDF
jgi:tetratricopeptide (TPR) repeat protein